MTLRKISIGLLSLGLPTVLLTLASVCLSLAAPASADSRKTEETVIFNTSSLKYHCENCSAALRCKSNCIRIPLSEARQRGGVACKMCGGTCGVSSPSPSKSDNSEEIVTFNTKSLKYHCRTCRSALRCRTNCVQIPVSEAKKRGGVPCKVCGGTCRR